MNQPQCAVMAWRGCRTAETEGRVATHPSWTKASLFPPSVQQSGRHELTLGTAQEQFIMGVTEKNTPCWTFHSDGRSAEQWGFIPASRDAVVPYVTTRAPSPEAAASNHTQTLEQQQQQQHTRHSSSEVVKPRAKTAGRRLKTDHTDHPQLFQLSEVRGSRQCHIEWLERTAGWSWWRHFRYWCWCLFQFHSTSC